MAEKEGGFLLGLGLRVAAITFTLALFASDPAHADVVTVCDEAHFNTAFANLGTMTFACDGTITITTTKVLNINQAITIDGAGHNITLDGGGNVQIFWNNTGELTLRNLTLSNGRVTVARVTDVAGGAVEND